MHVREAGETLTDTLHVAQLAVAGPLLLVIIGFGAAAFGWRFRLYSGATVLVALAFGVWAGRYGADVANDLVTPWVGIIERISVYAYQLCFVVFASALWAWPAARCALLPQRRRRQRRAAQAVGAHEHVQEGLRRTSKGTRTRRVPVAGDAPRWRYGQARCSRQAFRRSRRRRAECRAARTQYRLDPCHERADLSLHWLRARDLFPCSLDAHIRPGVAAAAWCVAFGILSLYWAAGGMLGVDSCRSRSRNAPTRRDSIPGDRRRHGNRQAPGRNRATLARVPPSLPDDTQGPAVSLLGRRSAVGPLRAHRYRRRFDPGVPGHDGKRDLVRDAVGPNLAAWRPAVPDDGADVRRRTEAGR